MQVTFCLLAVSTVSELVARSTVTIVPLTFWPLLGAAVRASAKVATTVNAKRVTNDFFMLNHLLQCRVANKKKAFRFQALQHLLQIYLPRRSCLISTIVEAAELDPPRSG